MAHHCAGKLTEAAYGPALTDCHEDETGHFWVTNKDWDVVEYASQVNYCPFCGTRAPADAQADWVRDGDAAPMDSNGLKGWVD